MVQTDNNTVFRLPSSVFPSSALQLCSSAALRLRRKVSQAFSLIRMGEMGPGALPQATVIERFQRGGG